MQEANTQMRSLKLMPRLCKKKREIKLVQKAYKAKKKRKSSRANLAPHFWSPIMSSDAVLIYCVM